MIPKPIKKLKAPKTPFKRTQLNKASKLPIARLKKQADAVFSVWVRMRGQQGGMNWCYTCGKMGLIKFLQNGHFIARHHTATRFDEMNCQVQCVGCNVFGRGQASKFAEHLIKDYGMDEFKNLLSRGNSIFKATPSFYEEIIKRYSNAY